MQSLSLRDTLTTNPRPSWPLTRTQRPLQPPPCLAPRDWLAAPSARPCKLPRDSVSHSSLTGVPAQQPRQIRSDDLPLPLLRQLHQHHAPLLARRHALLFVFLPLSPVSAMLTTLEPSFPSFLARITCSAATRPSSSGRRASRWSRSGCRLRPTPMSTRRITSDRSGPSSTCRTAISSCLAMPRGRASRILRMRRWRTSFMPAFAEGLRAVLSNCINGECILGLSDDRGVPWRLGSWI